MRDADLLAKYRDITVEGKTLFEVQVEIVEAFQAGIDIDDLRLLAGRFAEPWVERMVVAGEPAEVLVSGLAPGDMIAGVLVV